MLSSQLTGVIGVDTTVIVQKVSFLVRSSLILFKRWSKVSIITPFLPMKGG